MIKEKNLPINVLITSPSTNAKFNIGGISSVTKLLIENNSRVNYRHFVRGKKDSEKRGPLWLFRQPVVLIKYFAALLKSKNTRVVHINMPLEKNAIVRDSFLVMLSSLFRKKVVVHFHGGNYSLKENIPPLLEFLVKTTVQLAGKVITLGEKERDYFIDKFKINPGNIVCIPNSVNIPGNISGKNGSRTIKILYMGRIDKNKGLEEMISAMELLKYDMDIEFIIAGNGPDKEYFLEECEKRIPGKFKYLGVISGSLKENILQSSHIFLLLSYYEGLPYALLEGMANKMVPIVTNVGSVPEIVDDGKNGFLVPVNNFNIVVQRIIELKTNSPLMEEMSLNAYNTARSKYSMSEYIDRINSIYLNMLSA
jgi:glycosyltransferase involved in cell wall biosynthesis